jgi:hypothetical protein
MLPCSSPLRSASISSSWLCRRSMPGVAAHQGPGDPCDDPCGSGVYRECSAVVAAIPQLPVFALAAILLVALVATPHGHTRGDAEAWLWPPKRRRALLQIFLI